MSFQKGTNHFFPRHRVQWSWLMVFEDNYVASIVNLAPVWWHFSVRNVKREEGYQKATSPCRNLWGCVMVKARWFTEGQLHGHMASALNLDLYTEGSFIFCSCCLLIISNFLFECEGCKWIQRTNGTSPGGLEHGSWAMLFPIYPFAPTAPAWSPQSLAPSSQESGFAQLLLSSSTSALLHSTWSGNQFLLPGDLPSTTTLCC